MRLGPLALGLLAASGLAILSTPPPLTAQVPPHARWATLESPHFRVTYAPGLEELARHTVARAEVAHQRLSTELARAPAGKIDILLTDYIDTANGFATPFPSNRITLYARPPADQPTLSNFIDWIDLVVIHELVHIFHLDSTGGIGRGIRTLFGRIPMAWPAFPVIGTPTWSVEGLATYFESHLTGAGRVNGSYYEMILRTAILGDAFPTIDQVSGTGASWPGGLRAYIFGSLFLAYLGEVYGPEVQRRLVDATSNAWLPPPLAFSRLARQPTGATFSELYDEWRRTLEGRYQPLADSLRAAGLTAPERVAKGGQQTQRPRVAPDGRVIFAAADGRRGAESRVLDPRTGKVRRHSRRNGVGPTAWYPDGAILIAQLEYDGPYRIFSDLYRIDAQGEQRLTRGARLTEPDLTPDGRYVVAVQGGEGTNQLVLIDLESKLQRPLTTPDPNIHWASPRWSPDGARIAAIRWEDGVYDVVVLDTLGTPPRHLTRDHASNAAPAWSPDGRYLIFSSDRNGIPNLYAYDVQGVIESGTGPAPDHAALWQVTNLLGGAFYPDVSPDGKWLYFSGYDVDGFHIERIPFDPSTWREAQPARVVVRSASTSSEVAAQPRAVDRPRNDAADQPSEIVGPARPYSPLPTLLPSYWIPTFSTSEGAGNFFGARIGGADLVDRHAYSLQVGYNPSDKLFAGDLAYRYAGLGMPILGLGVGRSWEGVPLTLEGAPRARVLQSADELHLSATLRRRRYRSVADLTLIAESSRRNRTLQHAAGYRLVDPRDKLYGAVVHLGFANQRSQPLSISPENGVSLSLSARRRWDPDPFRDNEGRLIDHGYDELSGQFRAYRAFDLPGFAQHVLALRVGARARQGPGAAAVLIGGSSGATLDLGITTIGEGSTLLPVRGFDRGAQAGTRAWTGTIEYRFPIALIERGAGLSPLFLDRISGAFFLDAGGASCAATERGRINGCATETEPLLLSAGTEIGTDLSFFFAWPTHLRGGLAVPLQGARTQPKFYLQLGLPF